MEELRAKYFKFICLAPGAYYILYGNNKRLHNSDSIGLISVNSSCGRFWATVHYGSAVLDSLDFLFDLFFNNVNTFEKKHVCI